MSRITVISATELYDDVADSERRTPDGSAPPGVAGYRVGPERLTTLCAACGRESDDVHPHDDGRPLHEFDYDYLRTDSEVDYPGETCEECGSHLPVNVLIYHDGPAPERVQVRDPDRHHDPADACIIEEDGDTVRIMLMDRLGSHGDFGSMSWVPEKDVIRA